MKDRQEHSVSAGYRDMAGARRAVSALEAQGVEATKIRLSGEGVDAVRRDDATGRSARRDRTIMGHVLWKGVVWSIIGAVPGAALGLALELSGIAPIGAVLNIILWALFGHILGAIVGIYLALGAGEAWEMAFEDIRQPVTVTVRSLDEDDIDRARRVLGDAVRPAEVPTSAAREANRWSRSTSGRTRPPSEAAARVRRRPKKSGNGA